MAIRRQLVSVAFGLLLLLTRSNTISESVNPAFVHGIGTASAVPTEATCANPPPGEVACMAILRTDSGSATLAFLTRPNDVQALPATAPKGLGPADLRKAYRIPHGGRGQTIALIDAYDDPKAEADLNVYRAQFGLGACTTRNGCFRKVAQDGSTNYPRANMSWAGETSLDIEMAAAICPACNIMLVEANTAALSDMAVCVNRAAALHANVVSNSYGGHEFREETAFEENYHHAGIIMTASAGDSGFGAQFPAASRYVVSVGGTELRLGGGTRGYTETAWTGTGSGCSAYEPKPAWQHDTSCSNRTANDVAFDASPNSPVAVYESFCGGSVCGWIQYAGTSIGAPAVAAMYAVAGNANRLVAAESLYTAKRSSLNDITAGTNGICTAPDLCGAVPGYDAPSGNGSPEGLAAL